ncbi:uncharacterized protein [Solanum lycopersicum]|uniref:uncharacterized protein n=1 Tax=Solanum lycopersicum TaxID=4081 RepID=UPI0002BC9158|nr:uncharacterized protein LOC101267586 [Solanum lycopersicum]
MHPKFNLRGRLPLLSFERLFQMLNQAVTNQVGQQRGARQEGDDTSRVREFLSMNPPCFFGSSTTEDPKNFMEELVKVFVQVEEEKLREREEYRNKKSKTENDFGQQKCGLNRPQGHAPSSPSAPVPKTKCGQEGNFMKECPKNKQGGRNPGNRAQSSPVAPLDKVAPRGATCSIGEGANHLYAIIFVAKRKRNLLMLSRL